MKSKLIDIFYFGLAGTSGTLSVMSLLADLHRDGLTVVMVTHDLSTLAGLATHVAVLADQHIIAFGPKAEVMTVDHPFVTGFFGADRRKLL